MKILAAALLLALSARADPEVRFGTQDQVAPEKIAARIQRAAMEGARKAGLSPRYEKRVVEAIRERVVPKILGDPALRQNDGANQTQVRSAEKVVAAYPEFFKLRRELEAARDPGRRAELLGRMKVLRSDIQDLLGATGPLEPILEFHRDDRPGQGGAAGGRGDDDAGGGGIGPALGGLIQGALDAQNGRHDDAVNDYKDVLRGDKSNSGALSGMASSLYELGRYGEAYDAAQQALALNAGDRNALTVMKFSEGRVGASGEDGGAPTGGGAEGGGATSGGAAGAAASAPGSGSGATVVAATARAPLGSVAATREALDVGDLEAALAHATIGLASDPRSPELLGLRAKAEARMRNYQASELDASAALELSPGSLELLRTKGLAQLRGRKYKNALATGNELIEAAPNDAFGYGLRGHAYGNLGDKESMRADLERAAALDPRYVALGAQAARVQKPEDADVLFLFPDEPGAGPAPAAPARGRSFRVVVGFGAAGGLLIAAGLWSFVRGKSAAKAAPAVAGQYEIARPIGAGGMGLVYEGHDRVLKRRVAIKKMRDELRADPRERARFVAEARTVAALRHPGVVDIYAIAEEGDDVYLVFEFVDGRTVHEILRTKGRLPAADVARIARGIADALEAAHARGIVHRDVKPSNVMIDAEGRVKVMDFGIARAAKDAITRLTRTQTTTGTPPYMSPEQERGEVRPQSDVYALAVCAYEMLTGALPFIGTGAGMLLNKTNMKFSPPSRAGLPAAFDAVFSKALQADPEKRFKTPREFADALESILASKAS